MYKLIATTALVAITASSASAWNNAETLIENLHGVYTNLDGPDKFTTLQTTGELKEFLTEVDSGVTYLSLAVDGNNQITATVSEGTSLPDIQAKADNLVNRVNYDLFVETADTTYDAGGNYEQSRVDLKFDPVADTDPIDYQVIAYKDGLLGAKVTKLVAGVNSINDFLVGTTDTSGFKDAWTAGSGTYGADIAVVQGHITGLNAATGVISNADTGALNDNINGTTGFGNLTEGTVNNFKIPGITADGKVALGAGASYDSLLLWAQAQP